MGSDDGVEPSTGPGSNGAGSPSASHATSTASGSGVAASGSSVASSGSGSGGAGGIGGNGSGGSGGIGGNGCYTEGYNPNAALADLENGYSSKNWLATMLSTLDRRYHNGWVVLDAMKGDPWLTNDLPDYYSMSSWDGMMEAVDTACHEETHGYDFEQALGLSGKHLFFMGENLEVIAPKLEFFPRDEILAAVTQGGSVTDNYDSTYLTGEQGTYDFIFLADELTAYINGLACAVSVVDQLQSTASYRDGVAAHLLYLQIYLRIARQNYPAFYSQWKANPAWQKFVRFSWARGNFWTAVAAPHAKLGIDDAAIWQRIQQPQNLAEIKEFTGDEANVVACTP